MSQNSYFDHMASTACHPDVINTLQQYLKQPEFIANPSADHVRGQHCQASLQTFENQFLNRLGNKSGKIIWTSGATEAINLALYGLCHQYRHCGSHIISTQTEHKASLETLKELESQGFEVTLLPVQKNGLICMQKLKSAMRKNTLLVSIMHVHNEIGCIQDIEAISDICYAKGILLHLDCAQTIGKTSLKLPKHITAASFSAHKCHGPQGIGALYLNDNPKRKLKAIIHGGGQQSHIRSGTIPLFLIAGFMKAIELFHQHHETHDEHYQYLRKQFIDNLHKSIIWNSSKAYGIKQLINIRLPAVDQARLRSLKQKFCISSYSACQSSHHSHVLSAIGLTNKEQAYVLRISLAYDTQISQVHDIIDTINELINSSNEKK